MRIRARVTLRNEHMLAAREGLGLSQITLADNTGVPLPIIAALESLDYSFVTPGNASLRETQVRAIATELSLAVELVVPEGLAGKKIQSSATRVVEAEPENLLGLSQSTRELALGDFAGTEVPAREARELIDRVFNRLPSEDRRVLRQRYLEGRSRSEVAAKQGYSPERVRQIEARALATSRRLAARMVGEAS